MYVRTSPSRGMGTTLPAVSVTPQISTGDIMLAVGGGVVLLAPGMWKLIGLAILAVPAIGLLQLSGRLPGGTGFAP
jgi:hypothetical protein